MAATKYNHDSQSITIQNCIASNQETNNIKTITLPKGSWDEKFGKIHRKIRGFKISNDIKWKMMINESIINNVNEFEQLLSSIAPPIHIKIIRV